MVAMKRRAKAPRRPRKKARTARRSTTMTKAIRQNLVFMKRRVLLGAWNVSTSWSNVSYVFQLDDLPNYTEFTALFEQYKINAVKLTFLPSYTSSDANQATANAASGAVFQFQPRIYTVIDKDGNPTVSTEPAVLQRNDARMITQPYKAFSIYIRKPCVQFEVSSGLGFAQAAPKASPWLDCENYAVNHHGAAIAGALPAGSSVTAGLQYQVLATYYLAFKGAT